MKDRPCSCIPLLGLRKPRRNWLHPGIILSVCEHECHGNIPLDLMTSEVQLDPVTAQLMVPCDKNTPVWDSLLDMHWRHSIVCVASPRPCGSIKLTWERYDPVRSEDQIPNVDLSHLPAVRRAMKAREHSQRKRSTFFGNIAGHALGKQSLRRTPMASFCTAKMVY